MPEPATAPASPTIQHSFADLNGVRLHYAHAGSGKLVLFLHGFPEFWYAWRNQLTEFGRDFMAVAPDMRGYNLSSKPSEVENYDIRLLTGDVVGLVRYLGAKACCLVGHDWGGAVAWAVAIAAPQVVERLVIINAPHPGVFERELRENPAQQQASQYMLRFQDPHMEEMISANNFAQFQEGILGALLRQGIFTEADRQSYLDAWSQPGALTGGLNYYRAAKIGPPGASAAKSFLTRAESSPLEVTVPTLVIWGEKDPYLMTSNLDGLERYVQNLKVQRVPDATHWVVHEKPTLVNSSIRSFIAA